MSSPAARVVVVEDHPVTRMGVVTLLEQHGVTVVGEADTGEAALAVVASTRPDVVVTDLRLGEGMDGVAVTAAVRDTTDPPAVLVLTTYDTDRDIVRAVEAGAAGYLLKDAPPADIVTAVRDAAADLTVLAPAMAARVITHLRSPRHELSERELEILRHVAEGLPNKQVARSLFISEATVKTHLVHIYTKLDVDSRTAAVARARDEGLLP